MGHIKNIANQSNLQTFPGALFSAEGDVPIAQCQETIITSATGDIGAPYLTLVDPGKFTGINLADKIMTIPPGPPFAGDFTIVSNTDDIITFTPSASPGGINITYNIHDPAQAYLTRNPPSFARFVESQGYAYTIKGGQIYTNCPDLTMADACSDTWNPLT